MDHFVYRHLHTYIKSNTQKIAELSSLSDDNLLGRDNKQDLR